MTIKIKGAITKTRAMMSMIKILEFRKCVQNVKITHPEDQYHSYNLSPCSAP